MDLVRSIVGPDPPKLRIRATLKEPAHCDDRVGKLNLPEGTIGWLDKSRVTNERNFHPDCYLFYPDELPGRIVYIHITNLNEFFGKIE